MKSGYTRSIECAGSIAMQGDLSILRVVWFLSATKLGDHVLGSVHPTVNPLMAGNGSCCSLTDGHTDGQTLPSTLSPCFAIDNK